jgi:nucleoside 2-deoxyribosyltransferase
MKVIYIAGPFRAIHAWAVAQNVSRAEIVAYEVFANGHAALCPHTNTRHFDGSLPDQIFIDGTLELMRRCDAVIVLPNYTRSQGTRGEIAEAERLEKPIQYLECITPAEVAKAVREIEIALKVRARTQQEIEGNGETKEG